MVQRLFNYENSLVILCSHKGKTLETTETAKFAKSKGALVVSLMYVETAPLADESDFIVNYSWAPPGELDPHPEFMNYAVLYRLTAGLLHVKEGNDKYEKIVNGLGSMDVVLRKVKVQCTEKAKAYAQEYKDESTIYTMVSGSNYRIAYSFAVCILIEMQWINSHAIHAGEFFRGPFGILDKNYPFILLMGLDETTDYNVGEIGVDTLIKAVPEMTKVADVSGEQIVNVGSSEINK